MPGDKAEQTSGCKFYRNLRSSFYRMNESRVQARPLGPWRPNRFLDPCSVGFPLEETAIAVTPGTFEKIYGAAFPAKIQSSASSIVRNT